MDINRHYRYSKLTDISAPIIAGHSMGGISIDTNLTLLKDWAVHNFYYSNKEQLKSEIVNDVYWNIKVQDVLHIIINPFEGKISEVACSLGYEGTFNNTFKPGMSWRKLLEIDDSLYMSNGFIFLPKHKGIKFDIPDEFEDIDYINDLPDFNVKWISIFNI